MRYVIDIDNTILFSTQNRSMGYTLNSVNIELVDKVNNLYNNGHVIIIYTGRHWDQLETTIKQLKTTNIQYHTLVMAKPTGDYFIDDKAIRPNEFINGDF